MNIFIEAYHTFCEDYMFKALPEHNFYRVSDKRTPWSMRTPPKNLFLFDNLEDIPWNAISLGYTVSPEMFLHITKERGVPCIFHIDQMPPDYETPFRWKEVIGSNTVTLYWSSEEAFAWEMGKQVVHHHPIDCEFWKGYNPIIPHAITVATRPISSWGNQVKGYYILKEAYKHVPIQVVAAADPEFPLSSPMIESEEHMRATLASHSVYFNCAWKLDRTALEAMAIGLPVVAIRTPQNVYRDLFVHGEDIIYCNTMEEMVEQTNSLIKNTYKARLIGRNARIVVCRNFTVVAANKKWNDSFALALEVKK
jgi:hypothetical protein